MLPDDERLGMRLQAEIACHFDIQPGFASDLKPFSTVFSKPGTVNKKLV
tara:strand:+ start:1543 stop:1689 length:147 start_codon:yes stop_codon:yes gene_type:complete